MIALVLCSLALVPFAGGVDPDPLGGASPARADPLAADPPADATPAPESYAGVRARAERGPVRMAVGVPAPAGYVRVADAPAAVPAGLYECGPSPAGPVMRPVPAARPAAVFLTPACGPTGCPPFLPR